MSNSAMVLLTKRLAVIVLVFLGVLTWSVIIGRDRSLSPATRGTIQAQHIAVKQKKRQILYRVTGLGALEYDSIATAINNKSQVVGRASRYGVKDVFIWQTGKMRDLGTLTGKTQSRPSDINAAGDIVGSASNEGGYSGNPPRAFLLRNGVYRLLFPDGRYSEALAINDRGQIVGETGEQPSLRRAFLWQEGKLIMIGSLSGGDTLANDINSSGQVVGDSAVGNESLHGFLWESGTMRDLGTLGGGKIRGGRNK